MSKKETELVAPSVVLSGRYYRTYPLTSPLGHTEERLELEIDRTVFLIVDAYGPGFDKDIESANIPDFYRRINQDNYDIVVNYIVPARRAAKRIGVKVIYLTNHLSPGLTERTEWRNLSLRVHGIDVLTAWREPNDILKFSDVIAPTEDDFVIRKQMYSGFFETHLDSLLRSLDAHNLVTVGFDSQICLATTITDAMYRNYRVVVLRDAIGTVESPETAAGRWGSFAAVRFIETNVGYTCTTRQWIEATERR